MSKILNYQGTLGKVFERPPHAFFITPHGNGLKMGIAYWNIMCKEDARPLQPAERKQAAIWLKEIRSSGVKPFSFIES